MSTIEVEIVNPSDAEKFLFLAKNMKFVKDARIITDTEDLSVDIDWSRPGRLATDEEIDKMLDDCENDIKTGKVYPLEVARAKTIEYLKSLNKA